MKSASQPCFREFVIVILRQVFDLFFQAVLSSRLLLLRLLLMMLLVVLVLLGGLLPDVAHTNVRTPF